MKGVKARCSVFLIFICTTIIAACNLAEAAEKENDKKPPMTRYWMDVATQNQSIPGMSGDNSPMSGLMGKMMGSRGFGPKRSMFLRLNSPNEMPSAPMADHDIPQGLKMGDALPLIIPPQEKTRYERSEEDIKQPVEKPKMRMLIYWGCNETVGKGQPRVIDTQKMTPEDFGKAMMPKHAVSAQYPPTPKTGRIYADWPNKKSNIQVPNDGSLLGAQFVHGNYIPDIKFTVDENHDFMAPVEFTSVEGGLSDSIKFRWKSVPTAIGYYAMAVSHNEKTGEAIFWVSSEVPDTGFGLMNYLPPGDVRILIKDKVVMGPEKTQCAIPKGIFKDTAGSMIQFVAYGDELNVTYPPKPKDARAPWKPIWTVKMRLKSVGMFPIGTGDMQRKDMDTTEKNSDGEKGKDADRPENGSPLKKLKGVFGF